MKKLLLISVLVSLFGCSEQAQKENAAKVTQNASEVKLNVQSAVDQGAQKIEDASK